MYSKRSIPCVGTSFGVERIYIILEARQPKRQGESSSRPEIDVYILAASDEEDGLLLERMRVLGQLTKAGIRAALLRKSKPKLAQQFRAAKVSKAPLTIILESDELVAGKVRLKVSSGHSAEGLAEDKEEQREDERGQLVSRKKKIWLSRSRTFFNSSMPGAGGSREHFNVAKMKGRWVVILSTQYIV